MEPVEGRRRHGFGGVVMLALCLALSASACRGGDLGSGPDVDRVTVVVLPFLTMAPFHIAAEEGYFSARNLEVEFMRLPRQQEIMAALARGEVDVTAGLVSVSNLNSMSRGVRTRFVAALGHLVPGECPFNAFVARRELLDSGALQDPEKVRGLRFDIDVVIPFGYWADLLLEPLCLTIDDIDIVSLPEAIAVDALISGSIDVTAVSEPFLSLLVASGEGAIWKETSELVPGYLISAMSYSSSLLDERPEVGERFAAAMLEAMQQFRRGKTTRNLSLVESFTGLAPEQVAAACWPSGPEDGRVDVSTLRGFQEWAVSLGLMDRVLSEEEMVDHRFIDSANARLAR